MVAFDNTSGKKRHVIFLNISNPSEKSIFVPFHSVFEIPSNKTFLNNLLQTLYNLIERQVTKEGEMMFHNKHLDWDCANKWVK